MVVYRKFDSIINITIDNSTSTTNCYWPEEFPFNIFKKLLTKMSSLTRISTRSQNLFTFHLLLISKSFKFKFFVLPSAKNKKNLNRQFLPSMKTKVKISTNHKNSVKNTITPGQKGHITESLIWSLPQKSFDFQQSEITYGV